MKNFNYNSTQPLFLVLLLSVVIYIGCRKDESDQDCPPDLPCATQYGANTFGCYIDGKPWVAEIGLDILDPTVHAIESQYDEENYRQDYGRFLYIKGARYTKSTNGFISISFKPLVQPGIIKHGDVLNFFIDGLISEMNNGQAINTISFKIDTMQDYIVEITKYCVLKVL